MVSPHRSTHDSAAQKTPSTLAARMRQYNPMQSRTARWFLYTAIGLLAWRTLASSCESQSQPNPIRGMFPDEPTGTVNGTLAILPIPLEVARSVVPSQYPILVEGYAKWAPDFVQKGLYPALLEANIDHDVGTSTLPIPDFQRAAVYYPYVSRLPGTPAASTPFTYNANILISAKNPVAMAGAAAYGEAPTPATFDPPCDAYRSAGDGSGKRVFNAYKLLKGSKPAIGTLFADLSVGEKPKFPLDFWKEVTSFPTFGTTSRLTGQCDNFIRFFNTSLTAGRYAPRPVTGTVSVTKPFYIEERVFEGVEGLEVDNPFLERNYVQCASLG